MLARLQCGLERRYDLQQPYPIGRFVSHDAALLRQTDGQLSTGRDETLLLRQDAEALDMTLFLEREVLLRAQRSLASGRLDTAGLDAVLTVVEGVSHVVCVLWHAHHGREVRALDLELQADVDKFVLLSRALSNPADRRDLLRRLFERMTISAPAGSALHARYRTAHRHASRYCRWLNSTYMNRGDEAGLASELARFYRLSGRGKRERIRRFH